MVERAPDLSDLNPAFSARLNPFLAALDQAGIGYTLNSGYRSPEYQGRMYANHLAKQAGQPLPYPNDEAPNVVAPAWRSFHNYGLATDFTLKNPDDYARLRSMAPQFGLSGIGASDPGHIQMSGSLADDINQYHLANWRPASQPAPAQGAIAYAGAPAQPSGALAARGTPDFYHSAMAHESGGRNVPNAAGGAAAGYYQFTPPTWAGIRASRPDLNLPENVMSATQDQQTAAYQELTKQNVAALQGAGLPITDRNVFMASFLGGSGASKFLTAMNQNPNASAADLFPAEAKENPTVFYSGGKPRSLNDVFALQTSKFGAGNTTGFGPNSTPGTTLNASGGPTTPAGGPSAPAAPGQPGQAPFGSAGNLPGFTPDSPGAKMTAAGLKTLMGDKGDDKGGDAKDDYPQMPPAPPVPPAMPSGGPMMMGAGGQNTMGQRIAEQGYNLQPALANYYANPTRAPSLNALPPGALQAPGSATGLTSGLPGTTLNSPSQLQTALMYGSLDPNDPYGRFGGAQSYGYGST